MRYALIRVSDSLVENVVEVVEGDGSQPPEGFLLVASETAAIGDSYDGESFISNEPPPPPRNLE